VTHRVRILDAAQEFAAREDEPLLAAALRAGVKLPHECTLGGCGTCRIRVEAGSVRYEEMPLALSPEEAAQGFALACQARAATDLAIRVPRAQLAEPSRQAALVTGLDPLCEDVAHLRLALPDLAALAFRPGQHMNVLLEDGTHRSFSMASAPDANQVDFHVRRIPGGSFTGAQLARLQPGDLLEVELPLGTFRYHEEDYREVVMVATGTGLAPLKSIVESLMDDRDCPPVSLYWGARTERDLYLDREIRGWAERLFEFRYVPVLSRAGGGWEGRRGYVQQAVLADFPRLEEHSVYLCGSPVMIHDAKRAFLAAGADAARVYQDGFNFRSRAAPA
jgi:CDP-4-dehydro-6-deoxyglucose reductase